VLDQRKPTSDDSFEDTGRLWNEQAYELAGVSGPRAGSATAARAVAATSAPARYVAVDEIVGSRCKLVFSSWPTLDQAGRLIFPGNDVGAWFDIADVRRRVDADREGDERRPIRIGDVFAIRTGRPSSIADWVSTRDISGDARRAAKVAAHAARVGPMDEAAARLPAAEHEARPDDAAPHSAPGHSAGPVI
jgi:hypothetical protein